MFRHTKTERLKVTIINITNKNCLFFFLGIDILFEFLIDNNNNIMKEGKW